MKSNVFKSHAILAIAGIFLFTGSTANAAPNGKMEICHKPGKHNQKILNISPRGVADHERHGDYLVTTEVCNGLDDDCDKPRVADNDVDCSDGIACTVDSCGGLLGCENIPDDSLCDDQDPATSDMCDVSAGGCINTTIQVCGNGILETPEQCDDGNTNSGDGCSAVCTIEPFCGDGTLDPGEQCDDGNTDPGDGCSAVCTIEAFCGNGILEAPEQCDDGNAISGDGCSAACEVEVLCPCDYDRVPKSASLWLVDSGTIGVYKVISPGGPSCEVERQASNPGTGAPVVGVGEYVDGAPWCYSSILYGNGQDAFSFVTGLTSEQANACASAVDAYGTALNDVDGIVVNGVGVECPTFTQ